MNALKKTAGVHSRYKRHNIKKVARATYHKAGFTTHKYSERSTDVFVCTPFHTPCPARYSVLYLTGVLSCRAVMSLPCVKGGGSRKRDGGIVTKQKLIVKQSLSRLRRQLPLHKGAFGLCVPKVRLLFLTSTAFVDSKAMPRTMRGK